MNKNELINEVARKTGLSRRESEVGVQTMLDLVSSELCKSGKVTLTGFGTFDVGKRKAEPESIPALARILTSRLQRCRDSNRAGL